MKTNAGLGRSLWAISRFQNREALSTEMVFAMTSLLSTCVNLPHVPPGGSGGTGHVAPSRWGQKIVPIRTCASKPLEIRQCLGNHLVQCLDRAAAADSQAKNPTLKVMR